MEIGPGQSIGPYTIEREIGRGGMGVVYLGRDTKLDRPVAVKALPEHLAEDPERLARFEREARTLAQLSHPNVAGIYGVEEQDGARYLVLEYVEGETLAEMLDRGPVTPDEAIDICAQIASGVEAAHEAGVIHRDLKPANIKLTPDGQVKVLDFGLAKSAEGHSGSSSASQIATVTSPHSPTVPGVILGTAPYMSPEQARGRSVDKRTDIWSFGVILYECLTGAGPFVGETASDSIGAILHKPVDLDRLGPGAPPVVRHVLRRCLERDRNQRYRDIGDVRIELLQELDDGPENSAQAGAGGSRAVVVLGLALIVAAAAIAWLALAPRGVVSAAPVRLVLPSNTDQYIIGRDWTISPDGAWIAFTARTDVDAPRTLWVRRLGEFRATDLGIEGSGDLFWSPDSRFIRYHSDGFIWSVRTDGADRRQLAPVAGVDEATENEAGDMIFSGGDEGPLQILRRGANTPEGLTSLDTDRFERSHAHPHFLPGGETYLFIALIFDPDEQLRSRLLYAGDLASGETTLLGRFPSEIWYTNSGHLVYVEDGTVKAVAFDVDTLQMTGEPLILAEDAYFFQPTAQARMSVSRTGVIVFEPVTPGSRLEWWDVRGNRLGSLGELTQLNSRPAISPDGMSAAGTVEDRRTNLADVYIYDIARNSMRQLTFHPAWEGNPVWSADGRTIYLGSDRRGFPDIFSVPATGGEPQEFWVRQGAWFPTDVSPDGRFLAVEGGDGFGTQIWIIPLDAPDEAYEFMPSRSFRGEAEFSPDGRRIAWVGGDSEADQVYVDTFPESTGVVQVSVDSGTSPAWGPDGNTLYFRRFPMDIRSWAVMKAEADPDNPGRWTEPIELFDPGPFDSLDVHPDGERLLLFPLPDKRPDAHVIVNWQSEADSNR